MGAVIEGFPLLVEGQVFCALYFLVYVDGPFFCLILYVFLIKVIILTKRIIYGDEFFIRDSLFSRGFIIRC